MLFYKNKSFLFLILILFVKSTSSIISANSHLYQHIPKNDESNTEQSSLTDDEYSSRVDQLIGKPNLRSFLNVLLGLINKPDLSQDTNEER
jgi:hypothetical protein